MASIVTAAPRSRGSARHAASRGRRDTLRATPVASLQAGYATSDPHECAVEVLRHDERLLARWSTAKPPTLSLSVDRRARPRAMADTDGILVHLHGTMAAFGTKRSAVSFGPRLAARIDPDDAFARECVGRIFELGRQGGEVSLLFADALLRTLALHVFTRHAAAVQTPRSGARLGTALVRHLQSFVEARLDRRLSRTELARLAGYDAREFSTAFRNTFGMTPTQYVIERRLDRACALIANTERDLADIAISAGFSSQSHLTSTLKKRRGITPLRLRRESAHGTA